MVPGFLVNDQEASVLPIHWSWVEESSFRENILSGNREE
jgi:hypothetical protein